jgi:hypothetical protein
MMRSLAVGALALAAAAGSALGQVAVDGGKTWTGWTNVGNSLSVGVYAGGSTKRKLDVYVTSFTFNNTAVNGNPIQAGPGPRGFAAPAPLGPGNYSAGAFANGNSIFGVGLKMNANAQANGTQYVSFDVDGQNFVAATTVGGTNGAWDALGPAGRFGDFVIWMDGLHNGPSNLAVNNMGAALPPGTGNVSNLPGGIGSGVGYNYAFRHFRQGDVNGSVQMLFDLTAMKNLYGVLGDLAKAVQLPGESGGWHPSICPINAITPNFRVGLWSAGWSSTGVGSGVNDPVQVVLPPKTAPTCASLKKTSLCAASFKCTTTTTKCRGFKPAFSANLCVNAPNCTAMPVAVVGSVCTC